MKLVKYIKKYKDYEEKELARRAARKKRIAPYKALADKRFPVKKEKKVFNTESYTKAIGNPYGVKYPKAKKKLIKVKKKKFKK